MDVVLNQNTVISIGTLTGVIGVVWWLGRKFQSLDDKLSAIEKAVDKLPCHNPRQCTDEEKSATTY